jgi:uncharacterized Fe-S cluster-containing protein
MSVSDLDDILHLLPGHNCGRCGFKQCSEFASALLAGKSIESCPFMEQERFSSNRSRILEIVSTGAEEERIIGVIDGEAADFVLSPLPGEHSCREDLYPFNRNVELKAGDTIRYRPFGCPITHFARILRTSNGLMTVHIIGPRHMMGEPGFEPLEIGICMVAAFEGVITRGKMPHVGETVRFLPRHCMMGKVHSGIVVSLEGNTARIEGIDLKVW